MLKLSYEVVDRGGNVRRREYPLISFRASQEFVKLIEEVMKKYGWNKSQAIAECILAGLDDYKKEHGLEES